ncbi:MAG: YaiI/YqxD family protein [Alphaproteobacteria bacterium]
MQIYIDGDACPVKHEALKVAARHALQVVLISNQWLRGVDGPLVRQVVVPKSPDAADDWIEEHIGVGDICVTADIPLAARVIKKGAACIGPNGKPFTEAGIGEVLATRNLLTQLREQGAINSQSAGFGKRERSSFLNGFEQMIQAEKRKG